MLIEINIYIYIYIISNIEDWPMSILHVPYYPEAFRLFQGSHCQLPLGARIGQGDHSN